AAEAGGGAAAGRVEREPVEHLGQLAEVQVGEEEAVAEGVLDRGHPPVPDPALVDGRGGQAASASSSGSATSAAAITGAGGSARFGPRSSTGAPISSHTRSPLTTPSSWKPQPHQAPA